MGFAFAFAFLWEFDGRFSEALGLGLRHCLRSNSLELASVGADTLRIFCFSCSTTLIDWCFRVVRQLAFSEMISAIDMGSRLISACSGCRASQGSCKAPSSCSRRQCTRPCACFFIIQRPFAYVPMPFLLARSSHDAFPTAFNIPISSAPSPPHLSAPTLERSIPTFPQAYASWPAWPSQFSLLSRA